MMDSNRRLAAVRPQPELDTRQILKRLRYRSTREPENVKVSAFEIVAMAEHLYAERRARDLSFPDGLFAEPAWDILLDLYVNHAHRNVLTISSVCVGASVPTSTGLRYIISLEKTGMLEIERDEFDRRRRIVSLSDTAISLIEAYLEAVCRTRF